MAESLFGTDGVRGPVGREPITPSSVMKLGWAAGRLLLENGKDGPVLLGKDTRISGDMLESAMCAGFLAAGVNVSLLGVIPTPAVAFLTRTSDACAGVMLSASHNPYHDNGIKFFSDSGSKPDDDLVEAIEKGMMEEVLSVKSHRPGRVDRFSDAQASYIAYCRNAIPPTLRLTGLKLVIDCANGAGHRVAPRVFEELGAEVVAIGDQPDGFNINENCGSTSMEGLRAEVLKEAAAVGLALDGDGDRILLVDEQGNYVDGDQILYLLAEHMRSRGTFRGGVVGTQMTNLGLEEAFLQRGIPFLRTKVGDRHVHRALSERGWLLGGETSGHIIRMDRGATGDGIVGALLVLQVMQESGQSLSELVIGMTVYPQRMISISTEHADARILIRAEDVQGAVREAEAELGSQGRVILRPSGTEPVVRVMVEGKDTTQVDRLTRMVARTLETAVRTG